MPIDRKVEKVEKVEKVFCKGSIALGSACMTCDRCKEELELIKIQAERKIPTRIILKMQSYDIDELPGVKSYDMYYCGWECDDTMWVFPDGRKFTTNHGAVCEFTDEDFKAYRKNLKKYVKSLKDL